jgi:hypothetical protein
MIQWIKTILIILLKTTSVRSDFSPNMLSYVRGKLYVVAKKPGFIDVAPAEEKITTMS